jgi:HAD superfamily hydrolase (TIGR01509 family)
MIRAVLFDMDGVLVDSEEITRQAAVMMFSEKGHRVQPEDFIPFAGTSAHEQICAGKISALPGVFKTMELCRSRRLKTAIATSADEFKMLINLKEIGLPMGTFDVAVFAEMVRNSKPDPEIYLTASEILGIQPSKCLVIEDAPSGLQAAAAAGMKSLGLSTTFPPEKLELADWIIPDLSYFREKFLDW